MSRVKVEALRKKKSEIDVKINTLLAREKVKKRKDDTRRKILIGGVIMKMLKNGDLSQERLNNMLEKHLDRDKDRELFGLEVKRPQSTPEIEA